MTVTLAELGEAELIKRLSRFAPPGQFSDDTAALKSDPRELLINTDVLVDGVHFCDLTMSAEDLGWRAVAANLSDLAASGAVTVEGITVALVAPGETAWRWVEDLYTGIADALNHHGGLLLGGDCSAGNQRLIAITALGRQGCLRLHRGDARPGDWIVTSGAHGLSRLGLALLQGDPDVHRDALPNNLVDQAIAHHRRPTPRMNALERLLNDKPKALPWRAAGTDSSDGLLAAVEGLCSSSHCGALLARDWLPRAPGWPPGPVWDHWCLSGGEDFELVLSLPAAWAERWLQSQPGSQRIGWMTAEHKGVLWSDTQLPVNSAGFDHYRGDLKGG